MNLVESYRIIINMNPPPHLADCPLLAVQVVHGSIRQAIAVIQKGDPLQNL